MLESVFGNKVVHPLAQYKNLIFVIYYQTNISESYAIKEIFVNISHNILKNKCLCLALAIYIMNNILVK